MFAQAGNVDLANQNHFVMILRKYSAIDHVCTEKISPFQPLGYTDARRRRGKKGGVGGVRVEGVQTCQTVFIPLGHPHQGLGITFRCAKEALAIRVFTNAFENGAHGGCEPCLAVGLLGG